MAKKGECGLVMDIDKDDRAVLIDWDNGEFKYVPQRHLKSSHVQNCDILL